MGVLTNLRNLVTGRGRKPVPLRLLPGERERLRVTGSARPGRASVGGELVLTTQRIVFLPWNTRDVAGVLAWALPKAGAPRVTGNVVNAVQAAVDSAETAVVAQQVLKGSDGSTFRPPTVIVVGSDGERHEFGVLARRLVRNGSPRNRETRSRFLTVASGTL